MGVYLVAGLGFGDEGKGKTVDALVRRLTADGSDAPVVVRYSGGAQAAHHVVAPSGNSHCFSQFGAGTLAGSPTYLGPAMIIEPLVALENEAVHLRCMGIVDPYDQLYVDRDCLIATPFHRRMNILREVARGAACHGSCGMGIGEARSDALAGVALRADDLLNTATIRTKLLRIRDKKIAEAEAEQLPGGLPAAGVHALTAIDVEAAIASYAELRVRERLVDGTWLHRRLQYDQRMIFEGAQGVLLDERVGFHPYTTWSDVTFTEARRLLSAAAWGGPVTTLGVLRTFGTRHGPGPFPTEDDGMRGCAARDHNAHNRWQGAFRVGHFDLTLAEYAVRAVGGVDQLALTHVDWFASPWWVADGYQGAPDLTPGDLDQQAQLTARLAAARPTYRSLDSVWEFVDLLEDRLATHVSMLGLGANAIATQWR